jgi:hypothetical protein
MRLVDCSMCGGESTSPRATSVLSTPVRFTATLVPGGALWTLWLCLWRPRTRTRRPRGTTSSSSPTVRVPSARVPVTTVPNPLIVNTRSTGSLGRPWSRRGSARSSSLSRASTRVERPSPSTDETGITSASASAVPAIVSRTSAVTSSSQGASTRSAFESTTMPRRTSNRSMISRCSRVCGMTPSSAATTSSTASRP